MAAFSVSQGSSSCELIVECAGELVVESARLTAFGTPLRSTACKRTQALVVPARSLPSASVGRRTNACRQSSEVMAPRIARVGGVVERLVSAFFLHAYDLPPKVLLDDKVSLCSDVRLTSLGTVAEGAIRNVLAEGEELHERRQHTTTAHEASIARMCCQICQRARHQLDCGQGFEGVTPQRCLWHFAVIQALLPVPRPQAASQQHPRLVQNASLAPQRKTETGETSLSSNGSLVFVLVRKVRQDPRGEHPQRFPTRRCAFSVDERQHVVDFVLA
eukprot:scaffold368_cov258-Pinguiococcus_pyrenoidosus.AAC.14